MPPTTKFVKFSLPNPSLSLSQSPPSLSSSQFVSGGIDGKGAGGGGRGGTGVGVDWMRRRWDIGGGARGSGCSGLEAASTPVGAWRWRPSLEVATPSSPLPPDLAYPRTGVTGSDSPNLAAIGSSGVRWWQRWEVEHGGEGGDSGRLGAELEAAGARGQRQCRRRKELGGGVRL